MDFSLRIHHPELLDRSGIPAPDIERNLQELNLINRLLGAHGVTIAGFKGLSGGQNKMRIAEIGCGGGDNLLAIQRSADPYASTYIGIDLNPDCIRVAEKADWKKTPEFIVADYRSVVFEKKPDILFASLFCHHFTDAELVMMLRWMRDNAKLGFFINDLHRHPLAYHAIRWLTAVFSKSYLVKNDAPLSVMNGFKKKELKELLEQAGISRYAIKWKWAFRWLIIVRT